SSASMSLATPLRRSWNCTVAFTPSWSPDASGAGLLGEAGAASCSSPTVEFGPPARKPIFLHGSGAPPAVSMLYSYRGRKVNPHGACGYCRAGGGDLALSRVRARRLLALLRARGRRADAAPRL